MCIHGSLVYDCPYCCPIYPHTSERIGGSSSLVTRIHRCERWNIHYHPRGSPSPSPYVTLFAVRLDSPDIPEPDRLRLRRKFRDCARHGRGAVYVPEEPLFDEGEEDEERGDRLGSGSYSDHDLGSMTTDSSPATSPKFANGYELGRLDQLRNDENENVDAEIRVDNSIDSFEKSAEESTFPQVFPLIPKRTAAHFLAGVQLGEPDQETTSSSETIVARNPLVALPQDALAIVSSGELQQQQQSKTHTHDSYKRAEAGPNPIMDHPSSGTSRLRRPTITPSEVEGMVDESGGFRHNMGKPNDDDGDENCSIHSEQQQYQCDEDQENENQDPLPSYMGSLSTASANELPRDNLLPIPGTFNPDWPMMLLITWIIMLLIAVYLLNQEGELISLAVIRADVVVHVRP
ncbi:hypothetical protein F5Y16DRAFT_208452 [Xylariaceae sp. FL0255]|nr:hypothetical protein F5Y16DRAFT_208452 [Xylariaceae sp. FL0255]